MGLYDFNSLCPPAMLSLWIPNSRFFFHYFWVNNYLHSIFQLSKEVDQLKLDGNKTTNKKVECAAVRKVENVGVGKVEDPAAEQAVTHYIARLFKSVSGCVSNMSKLMYFWRIQHECGIESKEFVQLRSHLSQKGPKVGCRGKVLLSFEDNVLVKVGERFDKPFPYGIDLRGLCDDSHGYFCRVSELCLNLLVWMIWTSYSLTHHLRLSSTRAEIRHSFCS